MSIIQLSTNVITLIAPQLRRPCRIRVEGLKVQLGAAFVYPDALILCNEPIFYNFRTDTITNPTVVFIGQNAPLVECWTRVGDAWKAQEWESLDDIAELTPISVTLSLRDLYDGLF